MRVLILDYGMGNLLSICSAFEYLGCDVSVASAPQSLEHADKIVLPGVGSFRRAMDELHKRDLVSDLKRVTCENKIPLLGICLGMQLLGRSSTEEGETAGLGLIDIPVNRFPQMQGCKIPHVGFNEVNCSTDSVLFKGMQSPADLYFTHSYCMSEKTDTLRVSWCTYIVPFIAAFENGNIFGVQFHPELSQFNGLRVLKNFLDFK